jgi:hypothetical protein
MKKKMKSNIYSAKTSVNTLLMKKFEPGFKRLALFVLLAQLVKSL